MFGANVTLRSLTNTATGIDITVPNIQEVEAPLGGISVEYEISIFTTLELFKCHLHKKDDVIHFTVYKAYKEVEDFYEKVIKKFSNLEIPSIPTGRSVSKCSSQDKRLVLDKFMQYVAQNNDLCTSPLFIQFLGINKRKQSKTDSTEQFSEVHTDDGDHASHIGLDISKTEHNIQDDNDNNNNDVINKDAIIDDSKISELFPKIKVRKANKQDTENYSSKESFHFSDSSECEKSPPTDDLDLFEEIRKTEADEKKHVDSDRSHYSLFDSFDDSSSSLFSPKTQSSLDKESLESPSKKSNASKDCSPTTQTAVVDDEEEDLFEFKSEISSDNDLFDEKSKLPDKEKCLFESKGKSNKEPGISLFEEQDLGFSITKDDEDLFFVAKNDTKDVVNTILSQTNTVLKTEEEENIDSLDELLALPEPSFDLPSNKTCNNEKMKIPPKPVPKPRTNPNSSSATNKKPQVAPRTVFLSKPSLPPKPAVPPKPKHSSTSSSSPNTSENYPNSSDKKISKEDLSPFDILQYIQEAEKNADVEANLFD